MPNGLPSTGPFSNSAVVTSYRVAVDLQLLIPRGGATRTLLICDDRPSLPAGYRLLFHPTISLPARFRSSLPILPTKVFHQQHQLQFVNRQRLKIKMLIELLRWFVNRVNKNRTCAHDVRCLGDSYQPIFQERLSQPCTFFVFINSKPC
jgi:hypothetical protein